MSTAVNSAQGGEIVERSSAMCDYLGNLSQKNITKLEHIYYIMTCGRVADPLLGLKDHVLVSNTPVPRLCYA